MDKQFQHLFDSLFSLLFRREHALTKILDNSASAIIQLAITKLAKFEYFLQNTVLTKNLLTY